MSSSLPIPIGRPSQRQVVESWDSLNLSLFADSYRKSNGFAYSRRSGLLLSPQTVPELLESPHESFQEASETDALLPDRSICTDHASKSTLAQSIFNAVNILMGIGILSLPFAFKITGWALGVFLLITFSFATRHTALTVQKCLDVTVPQGLGFHTCQTFGDFGHVAFGYKGRALISIVFLLELFAASVALIILTADSVVALFPFLELNTVKVLAVYIVLPCTFLKSLKFVSYGSFLGVLALVNLLLIILIDGFSTNASPGSIVRPSETNWLPANWIGTPLAFGLIMSGFSGQ